MTTKFKKGQNCGRKLSGAATGDDKINAGSAGADQTQRAHIDNIQHDWRSQFVAQITENSELPKTPAAAANPEAPKKHINKQPPIHSMKTGKRTRKPRKLPISWSNTGEIAELLTQYHDERDRRPMKNPLPPVNWERIAEKVNERFGNRRNARECAKWFVGMVSNHQPWHPYELEMLELVVTQVFSRPWMGKPVMWREVSNVLRADHGFTRSPAACERQHDRPGQNVPRQPVRWAQDEKDALLTLADTRFPRDCSQRERDRWAEIAKTHNKEFGADRSWRSCNAAYGREALMRKRRHAPKRHQLNSGA